MQLEACLELVILGAGGCNLESMPGKSPEDMSAVRIYIVNAGYLL
jgi:hypothetical protein